MSDKNQDVQTAHAMLDLILTKAALGGKVGKMTLRIPHRFLVPHSVEFEEIDVIVTLETKWEQTKNGESEITSEFTEGSGEGY